MMADLKWWQKGVFYQIYPRSFADGNGDGIGDFIGIAEKLDYLAELGVDALWLSPHYPSPQFDVGYDITDYTNVAPEYGTLEDFQRFLDKAHDRDLRVILDWVLNHTSHLHPWFEESRSSRDNPKRDWYVWQDGKEGGPPNNWGSPFGGSAWEYDPLTGQYYYHFFLKEQPDLNWRNPEVKQAMWEAVRFWLKLGVDGYRLDAIGTIYENPEMPDHGATMSQDEFRKLLSHGFPDGTNVDEIGDIWEMMYHEQHSRPEVHGLMKELRQVVDEFPDRMLVGESEDVSFYGDGDDELHMAFNFPLMRTDRLTPDFVRENQKERLGLLPPGSWPCNTLNNHDGTRVRTHFGDGVNDEALARISAALMLTLKGTPFLYNGEEIGMTDTYLTDLSQFRDPPALIFYNLKLAEGTDPAEALALAARDSRDRCRTPMQWANLPNAGFSPPKVRTWLPVNPNYAQGINVAGQQKDPGSMLNFYQQMLHMRRRTPALQAGDFTLLNEDAPDYLAFLRQIPGQTCLVVLNYSDQPLEVSFELASHTARCLFSTHQPENEQLAVEAMKLAPFEVLVGELI